MFWFGILAGIALTIVFEIVAIGIAVHKSSKRDD